MGRPRKRRMVSQDDQDQSVEETTADGKLKAWTYPNGFQHEDDGLWFDGRGFMSPLMPHIQDDTWPALDDLCANSQSQNGGQHSENGNAVPELTEGSENSSLNGAGHRSQSMHSTPGADAPLMPLGTMPPNAMAPANCACLSSMYLCLSTLQGMTEFSFPTALHTIRHSIATAWNVLHCEQCPKSFLTGIQNVQLLGLFILGIAERYYKVLCAVDAEEIRALGENRKLKFRMGDLHGGNTHLHTADPEICMAHFNVELDPPEWRKLVKRVIKGEVRGAPNGCCPSFQMLLDGMEARQRKWHEDPPIFEFPRPFTEEEIRRNQDPHVEHDCLRMVHEARKIVDHMKFE